MMHGPISVRLTLKSTDRLPHLLPQHPYRRKSIDPQLLTRSSTCRYFYMLFHKPRSKQRYTYKYLYLVDTCHFVGKVKLYKYCPRVVSQRLWVCVTHLFTWFLDKYQRLCR